VGKLFKMLSADDSVLPTNSTHKDTRMLKILLVRCCVGILLTLIILGMGVSSTSANDNDSASGRPMPPLERPTLTAAAVAQSADDPPPRPIPTIIDPTTIYNNLLGENTPEESEEASAEATQGQEILPIVTNIANGASLSYPNVVKPQPCVDFNDRSKWQSRFGNVRYASWQSFAVDDGGFYRANHVRFGYDASVGNGLAAKISSSQPYAAGLSSPVIHVQPGVRVMARVRYLLSNVGPDAAAYDWVSLGLRPDAENSQTLYLNGYARGRWAELTNEVTATGTLVTVLLQAHSPAALNSNVYFDDLEVFIDGVTIEQCEY
jgi:hypothetical protein